MIFSDNKIALMSALFLSLFDLNVTYSHYGVPDIAHADAFSLRVGSGKNSPPKLKKIPQKKIHWREGGFTETLVATDKDGDELTFYAELKETELLDGHAALSKKNKEDAEDNDKDRDRSRSRDGMKGDVDVFPSEIHQKRPYQYARKAPERPTGLPVPATRIM